ncbi:BTAD domain-containing putative transcriptional regulator [Amycolatopsis sp. NPDC059657]|uniref:BTAD domain-containing putative transcriptional regulator n=1 Tax=Amycolatopsis sp. NPDC059657 TaxID=3346899 RepID=UPI0036704777
MVDGISFRLLGGCEVSVDGRPVDIGHARQQCVLAVLLLEVNKPVTADQLVDRVWGEQAPVRARGTLQSYLTRLRRALDVEIARKPGGYVLAVDDQAVDVHRFRRLVADARVADDEHALALFEEALGLWRGEALAGLETEWLSGVREGLTRERHAAELDHADLMLGAGRHAEVLPDLLARAAERTLDERLAGQVMLALYRSGRQAEALEHYQRTRRLLIDELGADPGQRLQDLQRQILSAEVAAPAERVGTVHDRAARELAGAVRRQWTEEAGLRSLRRPQPLRVRWSNTRRPVAADPEVAPSRPSGDVAELVRLFRSLASKQLVVLGEPGAGKTVLALLFTLALLEDLRPGEPVPVLLSASGWDPRSAHLQSWVAKRLVEEYPALDAKTASELVADGRILVVLDGLDEMPRAVHAAAVDALDRDHRYPLLLTCRTAEYEDAVDRGGVILTRAPVVEIEPVELGDATAFLLSAGPPARRRWEPVLDKLRADQALPLNEVLTSPLMVALARVVYTSTTTDPGELLDFADRESIEQHLLDAFIPAAYLAHPAAPDARTPPRYEPEQAQEWLRFLARHLTRLDTHDIAWWHLIRSVSRPARGLVAGVMAALAFGLAGGVAGGIGTGRWTGFLYFAVYALAFGSAMGLIYAAGVNAEPVRVELRFRGTGVRFLGRFAIGSVIGVLFSRAMGLPVAVIAGVGVVLGLAAGLHVWLAKPADVTEVSGPPVVLRQDRTAALVLGLTFALALTLPSGFAVGVPTLDTAAAEAGTIDILISALGGALAGGVVGGVWFGRAGVLGIGFASAVAGGLIFGPAYPNVYGLGVGLAFGTVFGLSVAGVSVLSRAWGAFMVGQAWLAIRGRQPWRVLRFLEDAHQRGVLRQSGGVYQFRHARLRDHLGNV